MNRKEYLSQLEAQCRYCNCTQLSELRKIYSKAEELVNYCNLLRDNVNLDSPIPGDAEFLLYYAQEAKRLEETVAEYYYKLTKLTDLGMLKLRMHNSQTFQPQQITTKAEYLRLKRRGENPIVTIHCEVCETQVGVAS